MTDNVDRYNSSQGMYSLRFCPALGNNLTGLSRYACNIIVLVLYESLRRGLLDFTLQLVADLNQGDWSSWTQFIENKNIVHGDEYVVCTRSPVPERTEQFTEAQALLRSYGFGSTPALFPLPPQ